eukprot:g8651.t1
MKVTVVALLAVFAVCAAATEPMGLRETINQGLRQDVNLISIKKVKADGVNFAMPSIDIKLLRKNEDTLMDVKAVLVFDRLVFTDTFMGKFGRSDFDVLSNCNMSGEKPGVLLDFQLSYDKDMNAFEKAEDHKSKISCYDPNTKDLHTVAPLYLDHKNHKGEEGKGHLLLKKAVSKLANAVMRGTNLPIINKFSQMIIEKLTDVAMNKVNSLIRNPWEGQSTEQLRAAGNTKAGKQALYYNIWQILQQKPSISIITKKSVLNTDSVSKKTGRLFKPVVVIQDLTYTNIRLKLTTDYSPDASRQGGHKFEIDFDDFKAKVKHQWLPSFITTPLLKMLQLNDARVSTRKNYESKWETTMEKSSMFGRWLTNRALSSVMPRKKTKSKSIFRRL